MAVDYSAFAAAVHDAAAVCPRERTVLAHLPSPASQELPLVRQPVVHFLRASERREDEHALTKTKQLITANATIIHCMHNKNELT